MTYTKLESTGKTHVTSAPLSSSSLLRLPRPQWHMLAVLDSPASQLFVANYSTVCRMEPRQVVVQVGATVLAAVCDLGQRKSDGVTT